MDEQKDMPQTEEEWKAKLSPEEYRVLREKGTEAPFSGEYVDTKDDGTYVCRGCGQELFSSRDKFDAHCGWPSFDQAIDDGKVVKMIDTSHGMVRTEVACARCGGHLGHVFDDGPRETTGQRFCINSTAIRLMREKEAKG